jgi:uncharacterized membrane protein
MIISIIFFVCVCGRIRPIKSNIPLVLICNTYLAAIIFFITVIETCCQIIFGVLHPSVSFEGLSCQIQAYFLYASTGNVIYSLVVQALFRLFRVVFFRKRALRRLPVFIIAIIIQWAFVCFINLTFFLFHDFQYFSSEYRCVVPFPNFHGSVMIFFFAYIIPTSLLFTIYFRIIRHVRQTTRAMQNRQFSRKRDLIVLKRLLVFFIILQMLSTPLAVIWLLYIITGNLISKIYQLQILSVAFSQVFITLFTTFETPQIQEKLRQRRRVHPVMGVRFQQNLSIARIQVQRF